MKTIFFSVEYTHTLMSSTQNQRLGYTLLLFLQFTLKPHKSLCMSVHKPHCSDLHVFGLAKCRNTQAHT